MSVVPINILVTVVAFIFITFIQQFTAISFID